MAVSLSALPCSKTHRFMASLVEIESVSESRLYVQTLVLGFLEFELNDLSYLLP
jgi:hypothetical protein